MTDAQYHRRRALLTLLVLALLAALFAGCAKRAPAGPGAAVPASPGSTLDAAMIWAVLVSMLGIAVSVAALVWLPVKRMALAGVAGFGAMLALALTVQVLRPYLMWIALAGVATAAVAAFLAIRNLGATATLAVLFGNDMAKAETDADAEQVKATHAAMQEAAGVKGAIDRVLQRAKATAAKAAGKVAA